MPAAYRLRLIACCSLVLSALVVGCDAGFDGVDAENRVPDTALAIGDRSLVDNFAGRPGLISTVNVAWSGTDPDGYVAAFDIRFFDADSLGFYADAPEAGWTRTTSRDTTVVLPIPPGNADAEVAFEVRAIDDAGAVDPEPAQTVFPIRNSPPEATISRSEVPPDTTWPVLTFSFSAGDPDGDDDVTGIEVSFNDSTAFVALPAEADLVTFVAADPRAEVTDAEVFFGRDLVPSGLTVPGLRLGADNVLFARSVDRTDTTSTLQRYPDEEEGEVFFVRQVTSDVLLVNDYRVSANTLVLPFHRDALGSYVGGFDEWDLSSPIQTEETSYSDGLPTSAEPTLARTLELWQYIYWVSKRATNQSRGNNLPLAATVLGGFFDGGGRIFVNVPIDNPTSEDAADENAAIALLPTSNFIVPPVASDEFRLSTGDVIRPAAEVPGTGRSLPALQTTRLIRAGRPYEVSTGSVALYEAPFFLSSSGDLWDGSQVAASIDDDRRVALLGLPFVRETTGELLVEGADGDPDAPTEAIHLMLEGLSFPALD